MKYYIYKSENKVNSVIFEKNKVKSSFELAINTPLYVGASVYQNIDEFELKINKMRKKLIDESLLSTMYERNKFYEGRIESIPVCVDKKSEYFYSIDTFVKDKKLYVFVLVASKNNMTNRYLLEDIEGMYEKRSENFYWKEKFFVDDVFSISKLDLGEKYSIEFLGECLKYEEYNRENRLDCFFEKMYKNYHSVVLSVITPLFMRVVIDNQN